MAKERRNEKKNGGKHTELESCAKATSTYHGDGGGIARSRGGPEASRAPASGTRSSMLIVDFWQASPSAASFTEIFQGYCQKSKYL